MTEKRLFERFEKWVENKSFSLKTLFPTIDKSELVHIDLSMQNKTVQTEKEFNNPTFFESKLYEIQDANPTKIIAGGYLEKRALYTSTIYNAINSKEKRNVHLGVDYWLPKNTPVHSILDGEIVCSVHQKDYKGYGGFIIIKHQFQDLNFYTLYGHLSEACLLKHQKGDIIHTNEKIGELGGYSENGEWVPHLHFQVMLSLLQYKNDFPGVALESEIEYWKLICPNPNLLFK